MIGREREGGNACMHRRGRAAGFTLIEAMIVVALIGIMVGLSIGGLDLMKSRATIASATGEVVGSLRRVQADAWGNGLYTAFVVDTSSNKWWALEKVEADFSAANGATHGFDPTDPTNGGTRTLIAQGTLPSGMGFGSYGAIFPAPFTGIPTTTGAGATQASCSFCDTTNHRGSVLFEPGAPVSFSNGSSNKIGQQFTLTGTGQANGAQVTRTFGVAIVAATGVVETFEK